MSEALREALSAVAQEPERAEGWVALGKALTASGQHPEARDAFQRALFLDPSLEHVHDELLALEAREQFPPWLHQLLASKRPAPPPAAQGRAWLPWLLPLLVLLLIVAMRVVAHQSPPPTTAATVAAAPHEPRVGDGVGSSASAPAALGSAALADNGLRFTLLAVRPNAEQIIVGSDPEHDPFPPDRRPLMVRLRVENVQGDEEESLFFLSSEMVGLGESGVIYDEGCGRIPEDLGGLSSNVRRGEVREGNHCLLVPTEGDPVRLLLYQPLFDQPAIYFRLAEE